MTKEFSKVTPVLRPRLPTAERLLPYLRQIDANRIYTNFGPMALEFHRRLGEHFSFPREGIVTAASGTAALVGAILASVGRAGKDRPFALIPSFTFVATAAAVELCGYKVRLADVDAESFLLNPAHALLHPEIDRIGLVIPVAAFGRLVNQAAWRQFQEKTGIGVVIDGAACFEAATTASRVVLGKIPVTMSFHATKSFGTGEGGCAITSDIGLARRIAQALNFGFLGARDSQTASINGKMSEYHAAIGLAELDGWNAKAKEMAAVAATYRSHFAELNLQNRFIGASEIASCYALFRCETIDEVQCVTTGLRNESIDCRLWYGHGIHNQSLYRDLLHDGMPVTESLTSRLIGLPVDPDFAEENVADIARTLAMFVRPTGCVYRKSSAACHRSLD